MRKLTRGLVAVALLAAALSSLAATPSEFYLGMLQKGVAHYDAGRFDAATTPLRVAAFGFVDSIQHYQTAQIYLALTYDKLNDADQARRAARAVVTAERIESRYASLSIPAAIRTAFDAVSKKYLAAADLNVFSAPAVQPVPVKPQPAPVQTTTITAEKKPEPPAPKPQTPAQQPATTTTSAPKPTPPPQTQTTTKPAATNNTPKTTEPAKPATTTATTTPPAPKPTPPKPAPAQTTTTAPQTTTPAKPAINVPARFAAAEEALNAARLADARAVYRDLLDNATLARADLLRVAEGFYRARDFAHTLRTFDRLGAMRRGEEPYRYYVAVSLYETGQYARARQELAAVLPYIEVTPDVARYKSKIEGAAN